MAYSLVPDVNNTVGSDLTAMYDNFVALESAQIVDSGSTADGDYWRFENGLQICLGNTFTADVTTPKGAGYVSSEITWNFPVDFLGSFSYQGISTIRASWIAGLNFNQSSLGFEITSLISNPSVPVNLFVLGRWK